MIKNLALSLGLGLSLALAPVAVEAQNSVIWLPSTGDLMQGAVTVPFLTNGNPGILTLTNPVIIDVPYGSLGLSLFPNIFFTNTPPVNATTNLVFQFATSPWTNATQYGQGVPPGTTNFSSQTNLAVSVPLNAVTNANGNIVGSCIILPTNFIGRKLILTAIYNYSTNGQGQASPATYEPTVSNCWYSSMTPAPR